MYTSLTKRLPLLLTGFCLLLTVAHGQSSTATLSGTVQDENGAVIPAAAVTIHNRATSLERHATTNDSGSFTIPLLPPGEYTMLVEREGFTRVQLTGIILNVGDQKAVSVQLKVGDIKSEVQVTADAALIRTDGSVGTVIDRQFTENIPLNGRSFQSLIALTPGIVTVPSTTNFSGQFSVNGQRASANSFIVDGVSANFGVAPGFAPGPQTSGNLGGLTALGTTQSLVSLDALQEFKVQTSSYAAEFGRQPGGQISMVTRSGTNDFHGSLFDYIRNDVFDANDWFANRAGQPRPPMRQNNFGGTFGGPVFLPNIGDGGPRWYNGRNRTFFFFSYEGLRLRLPLFTLSNVPTLCLRRAGSCPTGQSAAPLSMQPLLNAFPIPNGRDLGNGLAEFSASYSDPSSLDATSIRIDHILNSRFSMFGRYSQTPSESVTRTNTNLSITRNNTLETKTLTLGLTASITPEVTNEFKINHSDNVSVLRIAQDDFGGSILLPREVLIPRQYDSISAIGNAQFPFPGLTSTTPLVFFTDGNFNSQRQLNIVNNTSFSIGTHLLKFGVDFRRLTPVVDFSRYENTPRFSSVQQVLNATAGTANIVAALPTEPVYMNLSAFVQDTWKISRRLTLDFGLRWDVNPPLSEANGNNPLSVTQIDNLATMQLAPFGTKQWKTTYTNFAPRFGLAYQLSRKQGSETVLRGGFGVFYDTGNDNGAAALLNFPFRVTRPITNERFPIDPIQVAPPALPIGSTLMTPYPLIQVFDPNLKLPYTLQWNVAIERSLGGSQVFTLSYVGAAGRRLLHREQLDLSGINSSFTRLNLTTNKSTSEYNAFQAQFRRRLLHGLQVLASYTWSHAIDEDSTSSTFFSGQRGNADFDLRHNFSAAVTYDFGAPKGFGPLRVIFSDWSIDTTTHLQSTLPIDLIANVFIDADGTQVAVRPNLIPGIPVYLYGSQYPGGRAINNAVPTAAQIAAAGCAPLSPTTPAKGAFCTPSPRQAGTLGRNVIRGLPAWQVDFALRRKFNLTEKIGLQFRAEAFNLFNHPNFGAIQTSLTNQNFGQATNMLNRQLGGLNQLYQIGGPRSLQFALKLQF